MRNNYRTHLKHEFEQIQKLERSARTVSSSDELAWKRAWSVAESFTDAPNENAIKVEKLEKERFRKSHAKVARLRSARGVIEGELFQFGEDIEIWQDH